MKPTAVEFAVEQLEQLIPSGHQLAIKVILEQAKEMEKQQIIEFVKWCNSEDAIDLTLDLILVGELNKAPTIKELLEIYKNK